MSKETACLVCLYDDSLACTDGARLSDRLLVKFSVALLVLIVLYGEVTFLLKAIVSEIFVNCLK